MKKTFLYTVDGVERRWEVIGKDSKTSRMVCRALDGTTALFDEDTIRASILIHKFIGIPESSNHETDRRHPRARSDTTEAVVED